MRSRVAIHFQNKLLGKTSAKYQYCKFFSAMHMICGSLQTVLWLGLEDILLLNLARVLIVLVEDDSKDFTKKQVFHLAVPDWHRLAQPEVVT